MPQIRGDTQGPLGEETMASEKTLMKEIEETNKWKNISCS